MKRVKYKPPARVFDFNIEVPFTVPQICGTSSDSRTNIWSVKCVHCAHVFKPRTTLLSDQCVTCPKCRKPLYCYYNTEPAYVAYVPGWDMDMVHVRLLQQAKSKERTVMFLERDTLPLLPAPIIRRQHKGSTVTVSNQGDVNKLFRAVIASTHGRHE